MSEAGSSRRESEERRRAAAAGRGARAFCRRRDRPSAARPGAPDRMAAADRRRAARPGWSASIEDDLRVRLAAHFESQERASRRAVLRPCADRAADPRAGAGAARSRARPPSWSAASRSIASGRARSARQSEEYLFELVRDPDDGVAAEAMELVIARSRRFDRFQEPAMGRVELPAELQHKLVWVVAAALRHYVVQQHQVGAVDAAVEDAAPDRSSPPMTRATSFEALAMRLARGCTATAGSTAPRSRASSATASCLSSSPACRCSAASTRRRPGRCFPTRAAAGRRCCCAPPASTATTRPRILLALNAAARSSAGAEGEAAAAQLELFDTLDEAAAAGGAAALAGRIRPIAPASRASRPEPLRRRGGGMSAAAESERPVTGRVDAQGRLVEADPPLAALQRARRRRRGGPALGAPDRRAGAARAAARHHHLPRRDRRRRRPRHRPVGPRRPGGRRSRARRSPAGASGRPSPPPSPRRPSARPISCAPRPTGPGRPTRRCASPPCRRRGRSRDRPAAPPS